MKKYLILSASVLALCSHTALAQNVESNAQDASTASDDTSRLDEIVVTAQRREQNLQDVPVSVTAVSGEQIQATGADDLTNISEMVPNVRISTGVASTNIFIRGIGSGLNGGFEQSVAMYIDGIYNGRGRQYRSPFLDIERVEILRGPQGILFGRNAVAGAISVTSASPDIGDPLSGSFNLAYENYSSVGSAYEAQGFLSGGLTDTLAARVAVKYRKDDGYVRNLETDRTEASSDEFTIRGTLAWEPTPDFKANLKLTYANFDVVGTTNTPRVFQAVADPALGGLDVLAASLVPVANPSFITNRGTNGILEAYLNWSSLGGPNDTPLNGVPLGLRQEGNKTKTFSAAFTADWDVSIGNITSTTGYSKYSTLDGLDTDLLPIRFTFRDDAEKFDQFSQEIRFVSDLKGPFNFIAGAYYDSSKLNSTGDIFIDGTIDGLLSNVIGGSAFGPAGNIITRNSKITQKGTSWAVFGEATFDISERLRLIGGLRYSQDKREIDKQLWLGSDLNPNGSVTAPVDPDSTLGRSLIGAWVGFGTIPHRLIDKRSESHLTPSVKIEFDVADDVLLYATYSEGYKGGGFNFSDDQPFVNSTGFYPQAPNVGPFNQGDPVAFEFEDEGVKSFEVGFKSEIGGQLRINGSAFLTRFKNLQVSSFLGTTFVVGNAASSEIKGFEIEAEWAATSDFKIGGSLGYLDFKYLDYDNAGCQALQSAAINTAFVSPGYTGGPIASGLCSTLPDASTTSGVRLGQNGFPNVNQDLTGQTSQFVPKWSGMVFARYEKPLNDKLRLQLGADMTFSSSFFLDSDLDVLNKQSGFGKINLRAGLADIDDRWRISIFARNVNNKITFSHSSDIPLITGSQYARIDEPRTIGVTVGMSF